MPGSGRETLQDVRELSGGPPECPGVVGRPSQMSGSGWEIAPDIRVRSGRPPECPGVVGRPYTMSTIGRETPADVQGVVKRASRMSGSGWEALPDVHE